jgi:hypothetical protein
MRKRDLIVCKWRPCLPNGPTKSAQMCTIVTAALQRQYLQTELILWITPCIYIGLEHCFLTILIRRCLFMGGREKQLFVVLCDLIWPKKLLFDFYCQILLNSCIFLLHEKHFEPLTSYFIPPESWPTVYESRVEFECRIYQASFLTYPTHLAHSN